MLRRHRARSILSYKVNSDILAIIGLKEMVRNYKLEYKNNLNSSAVDERAGRFDLLLCKTLLVPQGGASRHCTKHASKLSAHHHNP